MDRIQQMRWMWVGCAAFLSLAKLEPNFVLFFKAVPLCSPAYAGTRSVDQAGLEFRYPPALHLAL